MSARPAAPVAVVAGGLLLALSGCRTPPPAGPGARGPGLAIVIDQPVDGGPGSARIDDRRDVVLPAAGPLDLAGVAADLELDSVVIESLSRPGSLRVLGCALIDHAEALTSGWLIGRRVAITTAGGAEVTGTVVELGPPVAVISVDGEAVELPLADVAPRAADEPGAAPPAVGAAVTVVGPAGPRVGALEGLTVDSLVLHDDAGQRHAIRADAIVRLRVAELPPVPTLRCQVRSTRPGRHALRLAYRTAAAGWQAGYQIAAVDEQATSIALVPRYTIDLAGLRAPVDAAPADVALRALPTGGAAAPIAVWRGPLVLDGAARTVIGAPAIRTARIRRVYRGAAAIDAGSDAHDRDWGDGSTGEVWRELVFARAPADVPGALRVGLVDGIGGVRWVSAEVAGGAASATLIRVPLDVDPALVGFRERLVHDDTDGLADEVRLSIGNRGAAAVRVVLEEPLRPIGRAAVRFAAPAVGTLSAALWQLEVEVAPGAVARAAVLIQYP